MKASEKDIALLNAVYKERRAFHGEMHDHASTGGTSDGKRTLEHWKGALEALHMDFAAILDHKQVRHMYLPEWEDGLFIGGTEPGAMITDSNAENKVIHYNMVFAKPESLESLLEEFTEFEFTGGSEGHFGYPSFTRDRMCELIDGVKARGGFYVHPHPKQQMQAEDPCEYYFQDETGLEVFYRDMACKYTEDNYKLWTDLLALGKRVWACAGGDGHKCAEDKALTTIYAEERTGEAFLSHLREGDFTCGSVGVRMCIGETKMGGKCSFTNGRLVVGIDDFHKSVHITGHKYRVDILNDKGVMSSHDISCSEPTYLAMDMENWAFCRVEVFDLTRNLRIAIGNPIWNSDK